MSCIHMPPSPVDIYWKCNLYDVMFLIVVSVSMSCHSFDSALCAFNQYLFDSLEENCT